MENGKLPGIEAGEAGTATVLTMASCCVGADYTAAKTLSCCLTSY